LAFSIVTTFLLLSLLFITPDLDQTPGFFRECEAISLDNSVAPESTKLRV
jgi:hypothetical protein